VSYNIFHKNFTIVDTHIQYKYIVFVEGFGIFDIFSSKSDILAYS